MTRGLLLSTTLHVSILLLFLLAPRPPALDWDRADAIAVELVPAPVPPPEVPPVEMPEPEPEPEPEVVEPEPDPTPPADVTPPEPAPVKQAKPKKPKPKYVIKRHAPKREEEQGPSLAERLQQRLAEPEKLPIEEVMDSESMPAPPSAPSAEVHASDFPYAWYLNAVRGKLNNEWDTPGERMIAGRANQVIVRFRIHRDGRVSDVQVDDGSGTPGLIASVRRAVDRAAPFAALPDGYEDEVLDVTVRFTVEGGS